jgi:hypothetical protein
VLNKSAAAFLQDTGATHIHLLWDPEARKFAVRPVFKKDDPRAYLIFFGEDRPPGPDGKQRGPTVGASINCKTFLDHIGVDYSATRAYPATWNKEESLLEVVLPEAAFKANEDEPNRQVRLLSEGSSRRRTA